jgi:putative DNA primase/helicase
VTDENIIRLAALQDSGKEIKPGSEDGMALAFAEKYGDELRYVAIWGRWLHYTGTRWHYDDTLHVFDRVRALCREIALECEKSKANASAKTVAAVERLARSDRRLAATSAQWDAEPWLLNTAGGTFDLRTGDSQSPTHTDYLTRQTACVAAPAPAPHPLWTAFLQRVTNDDSELQQFLQRYVGYCLSGLTTEHRFVFAYGTGANGKGTFVKTVAGILGDYATAADMGTFIATNNERHPTDLAKLAGARLVVAQETERGRRWDESKIKNLTGGDTISARFMRQDFFDFVPSFKLLIAGNHKPRMSSVDEAMRRRLLLVPFTVQIPAGERDPKLPDKLKAEWPAILRWCLNGCLEWQRMGLAPPKSVCEATESYFADQDTLGQWLDDCTEDGGPLAFTRIKDLFASWKDWCEARNYKPGTTMALSDMLTDRGFVRKREGHTGQRGFAGLAIKAKGG